MNKDYVITINREVGSGGRTVGRMLAQRLGVPFYDKALINALTEMYHLSVEEIEELKDATATFGNLGLGGTDIHDDLVREALVIERIQHRMKDSRRRADRDGHHDDVALLDTLLQRSHPVHQAQAAGRFRVQRILVRADETGGIAAGAQVHGHGPADQAQAHDSYRSFLFHLPFI